jgi:Domain of unknown function (DUF4296)
MNKLIILAFVVFAISCNNNPVKEPKNLIDEDQMEDVLFDYYVMQAGVTNATGEMHEMEITPLKFIQKKHKIDSVTFMQNYKYYAGDINNYKHLNKRILARLEKIKK